MFTDLHQLSPVQHTEIRRLGLLFALVYFVQGIYSLPDQTITVMFKDQGLSATQVASFFSLTTMSWIAKPVYGLLSDTVPLCGLRRKSYLVCCTALATLTGSILVFTPRYSYWWLVALCSMMGVAVAFMDVLVDALMVEKGKPLGLTGWLQGLQRVALSIAAIFVGLIGGHLAAMHSLRTAFTIATCCMLSALLLVFCCVQESLSCTEEENEGETWATIQEVLRGREIWLVAGFLFFWALSPSFGPALLYYQTDVLQFSQELIGVLEALESATAIIGAILYIRCSRRVSLMQMLPGSIAMGVVGTLSYLGYRDVWSAVLIQALFGGVSMFVRLTILDLVAQVCPRHVEGTFFALLMAIFVSGRQLSLMLGSSLYDWLGYAPLVLMAASMTALAWILVPFVHVGGCEPAMHVRTLGFSMVASVPEATTKHEGLSRTRQGT